MNTERFYFPNGLTLLLQPLENSEVAALHFCVKAGYFCETDSEVGLAHLLEHMYFKGSANFPEPGTLGVRMKALGGAINATTSYDQTNYFCEVPAESLMQSLDIMADAFTDPLFPEEELKKECEVVIEEFNRKLDNPAAYSQEQLIQLAYTTHRMKRWRIGTPEQLRSYTRDHLFDYFYRYYQPQNMVVTVAGKLDSSEVRKAVEEKLVRMKNRELSKDFGPEEPPQESIRYAMKRAEATQSYLHFGFHCPGVLHPDAPVLEFLAFLLSGGKSARLYRHVVEHKRSASSAGCYYLAYENVGLLMMTAVTENEKVRDAGVDGWTVLQDIRDNGVSEDELIKFKNKLRLHQAMQREDALGFAELLSYYEAYGSYEKLEEQLDRMQRITAEEISQVAAKYLKVENLSVMEYVNGDIPELSSEQFKNQLLKGFVVPETNLSPPFEVPAKEVQIQTKTVHEPIIRKGRGATYILQPDAHYPFIAAGVFFSGGRNEESETTAGITHLLHRCALKGTSKFSSEQLASRFDVLGNAPRFQCYRDFSGFLTEALPELFPAMWDLLIHCLVDSQFPETELQTEKGKVVSVIRRNLDDNFVRPIQLFQRGFFGKHPYGFPESGLESTIVSITNQQLHSWKERLWTSNRAIVTAVGSFDPDQLLDQLEGSMSLFPNSAENLLSVAPVKTPIHKMEVETRAKKQTAFVLGFPAPPASSTESPKYDTLQQILSGMGGRLFLNLRSKKALAYTVHATVLSALHSGAFLTYIAGEASKEEQSLEAMWQELEELKTKLVTPDELDNAKNALIGNYTLSTQSASSRVLDYLNSYLLGHPLPYAPAYRTAVQNVTADQLLQIARQTFLKSNSTIGIVRGKTMEDLAESTERAESNS